MLIQHDDSSGWIRRILAVSGSSQLNSIEVQWRVLKDMLAGRYFESTDGLVDAITDLIDSDQMKSVKLMNYLID